MPYCPFMKLLIRWNMLLSLLLLVGVFVIPTTASILGASNKINQTQQQEHQHRHHHYHEHWLLDYLISLPKDSLVSYDDMPVSRKNYLPTAHSDPQDSSSSLESLFNPVDYANLQTLMKSFSSIQSHHNTSNALWSDKITEVSVKKPFIFFHQRKAGGSSLRVTLRDAALELRIPHFIPCADNVSCDTYSFPADKIGNTVLFAGHFRWGVQSDFARGGIEHKYSRTHFSCMTNYRHPIDRIESCIYYRFRPDQCLMEMSLEKLQNILGWVDEFGTTCLNEPFRSISGFQEDAVIDHLMDGDFDGEESELTHPITEMKYQKRRRRLRREHRKLRTSLNQQHHHQHHFGSIGIDRSKIGKNSSSKASKKDDIMSQRTSAPISAATIATDVNTVLISHSLQPLSLAIFSSTLTNARRCSPVLLELPESYILASRRFPTLGQYGAFVADKKTNVNRRHSNCAPLTDIRKEMVRKQAALELLLYEVMFNQTLNKLLHQDAPWFYFLHECFHDPRFMTKRQNNTSMVTGNRTMASRDSMLSTTGLTLSIPLVIAATDAHQRNELQAMLEMITGTSGGEMIGSMYQTLDPSAYLRLPPSQILDFPQLKVSLNPNYTMDEQGNWHQAKSNFRCTVDNADKEYIQQHPVVIVDSGFFHLVSQSSSSVSASSSSSSLPSSTSEVVFDKIYNSQLAKHNQCEKDSSIPLPPTFEKMAIMVKDPFHRIWKEVFAILPGGGGEIGGGDQKEQQGVMKLSQSQQEQAIEKLHHWQAMHKVFSSNNIHLSNTDNPVSFNVSSSLEDANDSHYHPQSHSSFTNTHIHTHPHSHSHLHTLATMNSLYLPLSKNISDSYSLYEWLVNAPSSINPMISIADTALETAPEHFYPPRRKKDVKMNLANYIHTFHVSLAFNTMRESDEGTEKAFYQEYYSLFFNDFQYHSLFQTHYWTKLQELRQAKDKNLIPKNKSEARYRSFEQQEIMRARMIGYVLDEYVDLSLQREKVQEQSPGNKLERSHIHDGRFQFFSYDGILDESFALQMDMLVQQFNEEELMRSTLSPLLSLNNRLFPENWRDHINNQVFKRFLSFGDLLPTGLINDRKMKDTMTEKIVREHFNTSQQIFEGVEDDDESIILRKRLACAFGSANTIDRELVLKQLPAMKAFYALNAEILDEVKKLVKDGLELIGLDPQQMHFMYHL